MRIQVVIAELGAGGAEEVAVTIATAAAAAGHEVTVASTPGFRVDRLEAAGVRHVPVRLAGRNPLALLGAVRLLRSLERPDVVHAHNPKATLVARLAFGPDVPVLTTLHGVARTERALAARILRWASDRVAVVSWHLRRQLERDGCPAARIEVVPNAVGPLPAYPRARARAELGLAPDAVVGLCLARMVGQKRHDLLVEAWASVADAVLLVAGDGPTRARMADEVGRRGLDARIRLLGERPDVARLMAASDFLVLPTDWEGHPVSVLEAMAAGLPVVASRVAGLVEHFADAALLVEPGSARALAVALDDVATSAVLRAELASRGRALVARRGGVDAMVARYTDLYAQLAGATSEQLAPTGARR